MAPMDDLVVTGCTQCPELVGSRSQIVNGTGPSTAELMFVGEAPGEQEDAKGEPFVGRSGAVLDEVLRHNGFARSDVRISNCIRCRPPDNRNPLREELVNCRGYLEQEIALVDPSVIITLGKVPSEHLLDRSVAVTAEAGSLEQISIGGALRDILISVHPAATLYDPNQKTVFEGAIATAIKMAEGPGQATFDDY